MSTKNHSQDIKPYIHHSNLIENIDDPKEDTQSFKAWKWLLEQDKISKAELCHLHKLIVQNQKNLMDNEKGNYRFMQVYVGDFQPPNALKVPELMEDWSSDLSNNIKLDPIAMHIRFERIHPFIDGNGRTGRMLMWWHQIKLGQTPTMIRFEDRQRYYKWFEQKTLKRS